jgi:hypothetical protein
MKQVYEGRFAQLTARLFWKLPEGVHDWLGRKTGGWRVVVWTKPAADVDGLPVFVIDVYCWERWPNDEPIRRRRGDG